MTVQQPMVSFVPFTYASQSVNEIKKSGFLNVLKSGIIGPFKPQNFEKGKKEGKQRGRRRKRMEIGVKNDERRREKSTLENRAKVE